MRRTNAKIVGGVLVLAIILVAVAYAAITSTQLNINGTGNATANQSNFKVEFIGTPTTGGKGTTTATIDSSVKTNGTVTVNGLTAKGDEATATYTVKNQSADLSADLSAKATSSNEEYFEVLCTLEKTTLKAQEETTLKVTVRLLKTPIDETKENLKTDIGVTVTAEPKQPGEENNGGSQTVSSGTTTGGTYLPKGFRQVSGTTLEKGLTIQDSQGNQYVWVEVPKTKEVYPTAGLEITEFTNDEYTAIETDLHTYTNDYRNGTRYKDEYYSDATTGLTSDQYAELKKKMLKSVYQNGGFYIGKYETGIEDTPRTSNTTLTETPVIIQVLLYFSSNFFRNNPCPTRDFTIAVLSVSLRFSYPKIASSTSDWLMTMSEVAVLNMRYCLRALLYMLFPVLFFEIKSGSLSIIGK